MSYTKKVTMKNIAEKTGLSVSAVSMILNQRADVSFSAETIEKVCACAQSMGYEIDRNKESDKKTVLAGKKPVHTIAVFCPNISNAYYATIVQAIEQSAYLKNYKIVILTTFRDRKLEEEMVREVVESGVRGIIFTMMPSYPEFLVELSAQVPIVIIGDKTSSLDIGMIETSNYWAGVLMAEHLYELGHRQVAFITTTLEPTVSFSMRYQRLKGIQDTFRKRCFDTEYNVFVKEAKIKPVTERSNLFLEYEVGSSLCKSCLKSRETKNVTAFIGVNDMVAYGVLDYLLENGYEIPYDFSVCGFDNDFPSRLIPVSLTSVEHYMEDKGKRAFEMLYQKIRNSEKSGTGEDGIIRIEYQSKLIVRDSTGRAKTMPYSEKNH